jgi:glycerophosphoryl diester phosphodiesterase
MPRAVAVAALLVAAFGAFVFLNNTNLFLAPPAGRPTLLAHRGLHQTFSHVGLTGDACTAERIHPPEHGYLENTLASMEAAFRLGADVVEFDIHPTTDGHFAVFHDWTLDCRTDGRGATRERTLAELKALDIGYGYTADGGRTFPFRGKGVGLMPSLDEVLVAFPDRRFLIDIKSNEPSDGEKLAERLARLPPQHLSLIMVYGGRRPVEALQSRLPQVPTMSRSGLKSCLVGYIALGWSGHVPRACRRTVVLVPLNVAPWLWGWPHRFLARMQGVGAHVFVAGPWEGEGFSRGLDLAQEFQALPKGFGGGIWTNRIDRLGPLKAGRHRSGD